MSLTLVTGPSSEPITLEEAKAQLRLDTDEDDALVVRLIKAARTWVEGQTKKALKAQTWDQTIDWQWPFKDSIPWITLEKNPVQSVTSITYVDGSSPNPTLAASDYIAVSREHHSYITPAYGVTWPTLRYVPEAITVRFVAGYSEVPEPLKHAIAMLVAHWYENREPVIVGTSAANIPLAVEAMISPYRG